ncbi:MAG: hypothetical protein H7844_11435 [Nitrospirae bacterium YQR-1]
MKKIIAYTLIALLITLNLTMADKAGSATYYMPYIHTNTNNVVYCVVSNVSTSSVTGSFTTMTVESGSANQTTDTSFTVDAKTTQLMTFSGNTMTTGSTTITLSDLTSGSSKGYSGKLAFTGASSGGDSEFGGAITSSTVTCSDVPMSCF